MRWRWDNDLSSERVLWALDTERSRFWHLSHVRPWQLILLHSSLRALTQWSHFDLASLDNEHDCWADEPDHELHWRWVLMLTALWTILDHNEGWSMPKLILWALDLSWISKNDMIVSSWLLELHSCWCWGWCCSPEVDRSWLDHEVWPLWGCWSWAWACWQWAWCHWCHLSKTFEVRWDDHGLNEEWRRDRELRDAAFELHLLTRCWLKEHWQEMRLILLHERVNPLIETCSAMMCDEWQCLTDESIRYWHWFPCREHDLTWTRLDLHLIQEVVWMTAWSGSRPWSLTAWGDQELVAWSWLTWSHWTWITAGFLYRAGAETP